MKKQFPNASSRYGAPMGRPSFGDASECAPRSIALFRVRFVDSCYDDGGAYWGCCEPGEYLYFARDAAGTYQASVRVANREEAARVLNIPADRLASPVKPEPRLWWSSSAGRVELYMTADQARAAYHSGDCESDVRGLSGVPDIANQLASVNPKALRAELQEYGTWSAADLADHAANLQRILWLAAGDLVEEMSQAA